MRIGSLKLESNLFLSPLAGYTNLPFRLAVREIGGVGLCTTDLVNARSLLEKNPKAFKLIETRPADSPLAVQLFGSVPEEMRDAARVLESLGVHSIDINMGCPVRKVCKIGGGSAMMTELAKTTALVRGMIAAVKIPVTAKMRLGWDDDNLTAPDLARALEDAGVAAVFVHGRTREQGFGGTVNLAGIRKVVEAVKTIPVIGNGDIITPQAAKKMVDETGCAGVSIGRGAFYDPWIFQRTLEYLNTWRQASQPAVEPGFQHGGGVVSEDFGVSHTVPGGRMPPSTAGKDARHHIFTQALGHWSFPALPAYALVRKSRAAPGEADDLRQFGIGVGEEEMVVAAVHIITKRSVRRPLPLAAGDEMRLHVV